jgi:endonuclease YncB( thermonuclease family)
LLATTLVAAHGIALAGSQLPGRVLRVIDGDSLVLEVRGAQYRVELADIDAPELNQPWGTNAAERLNAAVVGLFVVVEGRPLDRGIRGRVVVRGRDVALDLLYDGLAWSTLPVDPQQYVAHPYSEAERQAREAGRGLWSDERPVPPWEWRSGRTHFTD